MCVGGCKARGGGEVKPAGVERGILPGLPGRNLSTRGPGRVGKEEELEAGLRAGLPNPRRMQNHEAKEPAHCPLCAVYISITYITIHITTHVIIAYMR